ncbi:hypothetical protein F511_09688 [Dorcoceras hygrometricum]|uniref:Uncharacterized protein n=1 Tax=Dorcoceras hygrometricum TaxID=472368 RepID=A0A2Z7BSE3_9LAMI|nr:hypothetical protein F511_09688 [Dorcoceras hygrometricum]
MRELRVTSCGFGKTVKEVERRRFVKLKRCVLEPPARGFYWTVKPALTNKEFSSWTFSKANPTADDLAKQLQQQRFSSNDQAVTTQQRCKISNNANSAEATSSSPRSRFLYAKQYSLYRKLHHGNSKRFLTRTSSCATISTANSDNITADVIIADSRSCASCQLLILDFFQSAMLTSSLLLSASSSRHADVIIAESRFFFASTSACATAEFFFLHN